MDWEREEFARWAHEKAGESHPVDAYALAKGLGLRVSATTPGCEGVCLDKLSLILVDETQRTERVHFAVGHEVGHWIQRRHQIRDTEYGANYLASALLLPRLEFEHALKRHGWDLLMLKAAFPHVSFEAIVRRIVALREARAFVVDQAQEGRVGWYSVPRGLRLHGREKVAARESFETGAPCEPEAGCMAWAIFEHGWRRVIVLSAM